MLTSPIAKRLKELRLQKKMSMNQVAKQVGIAQSTYAGYETGYREPSIEMIYLLAKVLETSADFLIGRTDDPVAREEPITNVDEFLSQEGNRLHWNGVPLTAEDLKPIRDMIEMMARERSKRLEAEKERAAETDPAQSEAK